METRKVVILLTHAFTGWALCAATMGISMAVTSQQNALSIHAVGAPIFFAIVSWVYFHKFNYTTPLGTAMFFTDFVIIIDFCVVALLINRSFDMFSSLLGTWIPFALIFLSTYLTGLLATKSYRERRDFLAARRLR